MEILVPIFIIDSIIQKQCVTIEAFTQIFSQVSNGALKIAFIGYIKREYEKWSIKYSCKI